VMEKDPLAVLMKEAVMAKGQNSDLTKGAQTGKVITTVNQPQKITQAANQIRQVPMAA